MVVTSDSRLCCCEVPMLFRFERVCHFRGQTAETLPCVSVHKTTTASNNNEMKRSGRIPSGFRNVYTSADHCTTPANEDSHNWMNFHGPLAPSPTQNAIFAPVHCALAYAPSHASDDGKTRRYRGAFKVLALPSSVFRQRGDSNIETG